MFGEKMKIKNNNRGNEKTITPRRVFPVAVAARVNNQYGFAWRNSVER